MRIRKELGSESLARLLVRWAARDLVAARQLSRDRTTAERMAGLTGSPGEGVTPQMSSAASGGCWGGFVGSRLQSLYVIQRKRASVDTVETSPQRPMASSPRTTWAVSGS